MALENAQGKDKYLSKYYRLVEGGNDPEIYVPILREAFHDNTNKVRRFEIGSEDPSTSEKVIMVLGMTGSGKTTHINALANFFFGTEWTDGYRLRLIDEEEMQKVDGESKTEYITAYTFTVLPFPRLATP